MQEQLLHYVWQHQYFEKDNLYTTQGAPIQIIKPGYRNKNHGPDFREAHLIIDGLHWHGNVEIHVKSSDWLAHGHSHDVQYKNVVMHVVWEHDKEILDADSKPLPTIELKGKVGLLLLEKYQRLMMSTPSAIPCAELWASVPAIKKRSMMHRALTERLTRKATHLVQEAISCQGDWQEVFYRTLCRYMGFKINEEGFIALSMALPYKTIARHKDQPLQVEALLYGVSGLMERMHLEPEFKQKLVSEFNFLKTKYQLTEISNVWHFSKIRPANAPQNRVAQLARLCAHLYTLLDAITNTDTLPNDLLKMLIAYTSDDSATWLTKTQKLGKTGAQALLINLVVPLKAAFMLKEQKAELNDVCEWLEMLPAEDNYITKIWSALGWSTANAYESQALIELYQSYCTPRRCLQCSVGSHILK